MRFSKKHPVLFICLCVLLALIAPLLIPLFFLCVIGIIASIPVEYDLAQPAGQITQIAIVYEDAEEPIFDISDPRITVYAQLEPDQFADFLADFDRVRVYRGAYDGFPVHGGPSIRITYADGTREIIARAGSYRYPPGENPRPIGNWQYFEENKGFTFFDLLEKYGYAGP